MRRVLGRENNIMSMREAQHMKAVSKKLSIKYMSHRNTREIPMHAVIGEIAKSHQTRKSPLPIIIGENHSAALSIVIGMLIEINNKI